jgi:hypothetical protein
LISRRTPSLDRVRASTASASAYDPVEAHAVPPRTRDWSHSLVFGVSSNANVTIVVAQPYGGTCSAYHDWDGDVGVAFLNLPYNSEPGCAGGAKSLSHELAEAMTDPHPEYPFYGWTNPEVADPCNNTAGQVGMPNGCRATRGSFLGATGLR